MATAEIWKLKSPLLKSMREQMKVGRMADSTIEAYIHWSDCFFAWANCGTVDCIDGSMV